MSNPRSDLEKLPQAILEKEIPSHLTIQMVSYLAQCNKNLNKLFQPKVNAAKLLGHVLRGEQDDAENMLKANPALLYEKAEGIDYSDRKFKCSSFQAALGAGDIWMLKMMQSIIESSQTQTTALVQYKEQYETPDTRKSMMLAQLEEDLKAVEAAISQDLCFGGNLTKQTTNTALNNLQEHLDATSDKVIKTGEHFPLEMLLKVYEIYNANWNHWHESKLSYYSVDVIGYMLRFAPAVDANRFAVGLKNDASEHDKLPRSFVSRKGNKYFPLDLDPRFILGRTHFFDVFGGTRKFLHAVQGWEQGEQGAGALENYTKQKQDSLKNFKCSLSIQAKIYNEVYKVDTRTTTLLDLPFNILNQEVAKPDNLDTRSVINLSLVNKYTYQLFKPTLLQRLKGYLERSAKKQVEVLLKIHPNFDLSHLHDICVATLRLGDIGLLKVITKGREDVLKQIELPKKLIDENNTYDFGAVVAAIESGKNAEEALVQFRTDLDNIVKEKGFPFQALLHAYEIYDKKYFKPWGGSESNVNNLFSVKIIGYLQRLSPAWLKKALATGIFNIMAEGKTCSDSFSLKSSESIDPAEDVPNSGFGFDFCVNVFGFADRGRGGVTAEWDRRGLKNYLEQKQQNLELMQPIPKTKKRKRVCV